MKVLNSYFMDDVREAKRLAEKVNADEWVTRFLSPHITGASTMLDVGCGPGVLLRAAARRYPEVSFHGVDLCAERFEFTRASMPLNVRCVEGDALSLPFEDSSIDLVYCRFLLQYLPQREYAVREMRRVCKSGGRILLQDLDGQLVWHYPEDDRLKDHLGCVLQGLEATGFDPFVGRKLFALAKLVGLQDIVVTAESYHLYAGAIDAESAQLWETKLDIAMPAAARILGSEQAAAELKSRFLGYLDREDTLTYSVMFTVVGEVCKTDQAYEPGQVIAEG